MKSLRSRLRAKPFRETRQVTKDDVRDLLENFADYVNPDGEHDPWFEVGEINQQWAWSDVPEPQLVIWLDQLWAEGLVRKAQDGRTTVWAWRS